MDTDARTSKKQEAQISKIMKGNFVRCAMKYIHYWHFANQWYMYTNDNPNHERVLSGNECDPDVYRRKEQFLIGDSVDLTHRHIKEKLVKQYPDHTLIKEIAYHEGARWNGYKHGRRR